MLLVRVETSPEDLRGMIAAEGILTARGGVSSHAALVARQMGKVCVCGAGALHIDYHDKTLKVGGQTYKEGDYISIDGTAGEVYAGQIKTAPSEIIQVLVDKTLPAAKSAIYKDFAQLMTLVRQSQPPAACAPMPTRPSRRPTPSPSAPRASAFAAPSTCSSRATASTRCAR